MIRQIIGALLIFIGLVFYIIAIIGNLKFKYILNRMHSAGIGDSFALGFVIVGCIVINGFNVTSLKLIIAAVCLYFTSPICTHMLAKLEADTNPKLEEECEVEDSCRS